MISWIDFEVCNRDKHTAFENMCRILFREKFLKDSITLHSNPNNPGIEVEPVINKDGTKRISFQAKYFNERPQYSQILSSAQRIIDYYKGNIDIVFLYCNKELNVNTQKYCIAKQKLLENSIELIPICNEEILDQVRNNPIVKQEYFNTPQMGAFAEETKNVIKRKIENKEKMKRDLLKDSKTLSFEEKRKAALMPWIKFRKSDVIIRSIYDTAYPIMPDNGLGFIRAEVYDFSHEGLLVRVSPYSINAVYWPSIYSREQEQKGTLDVLGCVPYERIVDYDINGDEYYAYPHIYCSHRAEESPYSKILYVTEFGTLITQDMIIDTL